MKTAKQIIRNEKLVYLFKKVFLFYIFSFLFLPFAYIKVRNSKFKNIAESLDFVFNSRLGYFAPMQFKSEFTSLLEYLKNIKPKTVMEIGTARGGTLFPMSKVISNDAFIISLDLPGGNFGGGYPFWKIPLYKSFATNNQKITLVRENSHKIETLNKIKKILDGRKLDFLFIDGDHAYSGVKMDFELYKPLVRKGGTIAFHDITPYPLDTKCEVNKLWDEIKNEYQYQELIEDRNQDWGGIGIIKV